jgi:hypothetical protein
VCSKRFQARYLSGNIVGFNVNVNPALVVDALNLDNRLIGRCCQHAVIAASPWMAGIYRAAQRIGPEPGGVINIRHATINQKSAKTGIVHGSLFECPGADSKWRGTCVGIKPGREATPA